MLTRFTNNKFDEFSALPTYGIEFLCKDIAINGKKVRLQIWDTVYLRSREAGSEKYRSISRAYYRSSVGALVVYDITKRSTFNALKGWIQEAKMNGHQNLNFLIIGNKSDLKEE